MTKRLLVIFNKGTEHHHSASSSNLPFLPIAIPTPLPSLLLRNSSPDPAWPRQWLQTQVDINQYNYTCGLEKSLDDEGKGEGGMRQKGDGEGRMRGRGKGRRRGREREKDDTKHINFFKELVFLPPLTTPFPSPSTYLNTPSPNIPTTVLTSSPPSHTSYLHPPYLCTRGPPPHTHPQPTSHLPPLLPRPVPP